MSPHISTVTELCLRFMTFDPNYNDEDEEDNSDEEGEDGLQEGKCRSGHWGHVWDWDLATGKDLNVEH